MTVRNSAFTHTAMTGLFVSSSSEVTVERNVFTDIGYHGLLQLGGYDYQNITISNNYFDGSGITRSWSTSGIFSQGSRNVLISNNEVTRTLGNGIMIKSESLSKDYWSQQVSLNSCLKILVLALKSLLLNLFLRANSDVASFLPFYPRHI